MKRTLQFFAVFIFFVFAQNVYALTLLPSCQDKPCSYKISNIKIGNINDTDTSSAGKERILGNFANYRELKISWDVKDIDPKDKRLPVYRFYYGCSQTPDISNLNDKILETNDKSIVWQIPRIELADNPDCYCKIWISVRDRNDKDYKLGGANSRSFQICSNPPAIILPVLETFRASKSTAGQFVFNGRLINLGGATSVRTYFKIGIRDMLVKESPSYSLFFKNPEKMFLSSPIKHSVSSSGLDMSSKNLDYCYRIEGENKAGVVSGGTRCYPNDNVLITKPEIGSVDPEVSVSVEKISSTQERDVRRLNVTFDVASTGNSDKTIAKIWVQENIIESGIVKKEWTEYPSINIPREGQYEFSNIIVPEDFSYKIALINEDGKDVKQESVHSGKIKAQISNLLINSENNSSIKGTIEDEQTVLGLKNVVSYFAEVEKTDGLESPAGYCPKFFKTPNHLAKSKVIFDFSFNEYRLDDSYSPQIKVCKLEPNTTYKVRIGLNLKVLGSEPIYSDAMEVKYSSGVPELVGFVYPDINTTNEKGEPYIHIDTKIINAKYNNFLRLSYKLSPLGPGSDCDFFDNRDNQEKYNVNSPIVITKDIVVSDIKKTNNEQVFYDKVKVDYSNRLYCALLKVSRIDQKGNILDSTSYQYAKINSISPALPPKVEVLDVNENDKTWGGAKVNAILLSTGSQSDNNLDGKIDDEAMKASVKFTWKYSWDNKEYDFKETVNKLVDQKDANNTGEFSSKFSQYERISGLLKNSNICISPIVTNNAKADNSKIYDVKCFDAFYKPEIDAINAYSLGGLKVAFAGKILKDGNASNFKINAIINSHPLSQTKCKIREIKIPIAYKDIIRKGDEFIAIIPSMADAFVKYSDGAINYDSFETIKSLSCQFVFDFSITIDSKNVAVNNDTTHITKKMIPFSINTVGLKFPEYHNQYDNVGGEGCSTNAYMYLVHYWYFNNPQTKKVYDNLNRNTIKDNVGKFTESNFLNIYGAGASCGVGSIVRLNSKLNLTYKGIGSGYDQISSDVRDAKSYKIREDMIRQMYEDALSKGIPVVARTMRNGSQHFFAVRGIYFDTDNGLPDYETIIEDGQETKRIKLNDNDKIYITDTFPSDRHNATDLKYMVFEDKYNGYMTKENFLGYFKCFSSDTQSGYSPGGLDYGYYIYPNQ
jgi:hypothetical protein